MQRSAATPTQSAAPFFSSLFGGGGSGSGGTNNTANTKDHDPPPSPTSKPARPTSSSEDVAGGSPRQPRPLVHDRKPSSSGRKSSFGFLSSSSPGKKTRRRADSAASNPAAQADGGGVPVPSLAHRPSATQLSSQDTVPSLPDPSPKTTTDGFSKMLSRGAVTPISGYPVGMAGSGTMLGGGGGGMAMAQQSELGVVHQHIQETANKRISTLDYLRKASHEGRIYWFNTLLFDKPDLQRMPYFDARKLGRRATNYLLLGISLPAVIDLNSNTPTEFLRSLNTLLTEFDAFQQIHTETGIAATSLTRTRIPQMFRRAAAPVSKGRRSSSAAGRDGDIAIIGYSLEQVDSNNNNTTSAPATIPPSTSSGAGVGDATPAGGVMAFGASEVDLLPGEEYTYLLTPTLPFDPDFFETFATLCDALIDTYTRLLGLVPTARECSGPVAELFTKVDSKIRKLFIQGVMREFEESGRAGVKAELASVGKVVLSGLM
ncbi:hypothetical protein C8A01DRAFT_33191 [Parachaetomium inaequale]|uniref:Uncharacterized protein n=1 Tax=Parachaetomium inaequale TaxID=2588326 RepID=A0AAN6SUK1_9PEZI|nr:hypothetical protein C8A01DRAFT_33191 [Parachaetomium inaequale]